jgi:N-acetyl-gamma-glutamyl-phosphate reductase
MIQKIGIWGVNGYAGEELKRIVYAKPQIQAVEVGRGQALEEVAGGIHYAILALPTEESLKIVPRLLEYGVRVIDLSGAFRLQDAAVFKKYYGQTHPCPEILHQAVYGLVEKNRRQISEASLVANPGCYATAIELGLLPLVERGFIRPDTKIVIEAISGYTGAGKHARIPDEITAYKPDREHQHVPEIEQALGLDGQIHFFPHVTPMPRGIKATIKLRIRRWINAARLYAEYYYQKSGQWESYVKICTAVKLGDVLGTNLCCISPKSDKLGEVEISVCIDNLGKGAAGQAIQNLIAMDPSFGDTVYENEKYSKE